MQLLSELPSEMSDKFSSQIIDRFWNDLQHPPRYWPGVPFRSADGSNNSHIYPHIGASNTSYAKSVAGSFQQPGLPRPEELFDELMQRTSDFEPHPNNINSLLFGLGAAISHDLFHSDPVNPAINRSTHYADLTPLYGANQEEQKTVRTFKVGLLKPDTFADGRLQFQLPTIVIIVILFSRNHNYIAKKLLEINENNRFTNVDESTAYTEAQTDEMVFQTARLINCACYGNLILHEYLKTILGINISSKFTLNPLITPPPTNPTSGNVIFVEFGYVYRWHAALSQKNVKWLNKYKILDKYLDLRRMAEQMGIEAMGAPPGTHVRMYMDIIQQFGYNAEEYARGPICIGLHRNPQTNAFNDDDIVGILRDSMGDVASRMGARKIPVEMKTVEIQGIHSARKIGVCTLNEFRKFMGLKEYESYEEMITAPGAPVDNQVLEALNRLYGEGGINKVELYPGLAIEATKTDGIALPYTMSRAIVSDAVNLLRNDRFYNDGLNPHDLTVWGYQYGNSDCIFKEMMLNCFPEWPRDDPRLLSPFTVNL